MGRPDPLQKRFATWRRKSPGRSRIPDALWRAAVREARKHGLWRTARRLRLDYYSLKRRLDESGPVGKTSPMEFVELPGKVLEAGPGNVVELRDAQGTRLRAEFREAADASALARTLWENRG